MLQGKPEQGQNDPTGWFACLFVCLLLMKVFHTVEAEGCGDVKGRDIEKGPT